MSMDTISTLSDIMTYKFGPLIYRQWARSAVLASLMPIKPGAGKDCSWAPQFSGAVAEVASEGEDIDSTEYTSDTEEDAHLSWATYRSSFSLTEQSTDAAVSSGGDPAILADIIEERVMAATATILKKIEADLIAGTGTRSVRSQTINTIIGLLGGACEATGSYAGLDPATYTEWAGNVLGNGGTDRPLSLDLLAQGGRAIFSDSEQPFRGILGTTAAISDKYEGLWEQQRQTAGNVASMGAESMSWRGNRIVPLADCTAGHLIYLPLDELELRFLPFSKMTKQTAVKFMEGVRRAAGTTDGSAFNVTNLPVRIAVMGKTGDNIKISVRTASCQLVVKRRNRLCYLKDIAE